MTYGRALRHDEQVSRKTPEQVVEEARAGAFRGCADEIVSAARAALRWSATLEQRGLTTAAVTEFLLSYGMRVDTVTNGDGTVGPDQSVALAALKRLQRRGEAYLHDATAPGQPARWCLTKE